ncbi:MAG: SMC-Scp complex subunit ScpB [Patescibacteria group bacterium]|nr:SMC-Scp complex subunit ScpB [Patescibacteria group bacterium]
METQKLKSTLESLLFVSGEPVKFAKLAKICQVGKKEIEEALNDMDSAWQEQKRGLRIIKKGESVQLGTAAENAEFVNQLVSGELNADLSKSALETLSIVAYRGSVTRSQIEAIRGVNCSYVLRSLLLRGLVERKETADIRGYLYEISFEFLKTLGIQSAKHLPDWEILSKNEKVEEVLKINSQE